MCSLQAYTPNTWNPSESYDRLTWAYLVLGTNAVHQQNERALKRSRLFVWASFFVVIPLSLLVVAALLWVGREYSGSRRLKARIAILKKQGHPIDDATLDEFYKTKTDPTNTDAWLELIARIKAPDFVASSKAIPYLGSEAEVPILPSEEWTEEQVALAFLKNWKSLYADLLILSVDAKPVRFPIVFDSMQTLLTQTQEMRQFARLLQLSGRIGLRKRDSSAVRDAIDGLLGLSRVSSGEPLLVSQLVATAIDGVALELLKDGIRHDAINESDLKILLPKVLAAINIGPEWSSAIVGERAIALPIFADSKKAKSLGVSSVPGRSRDALFYIDISQQILEIPTEPMSEILAKMGETKIEERMMQGNWSAQFDRVLTSQLMPNYAMAVNALIRRALQHRMAATAIGIRLYEDVHFDMPNTLSDLSELAIDTKRLGPKEETSFGYARKGNSAKLWGGGNPDLFSIPKTPPSPIDSETNAAAKAEQERWLWEFLPKSP